MLEALQNIDGNILLWIQENLRSEWLTPIVIFITRLGNAGMIWIILALGLLLPKKTRPVGLMCAVALVMMLLLNNMFLKNLVARIRPYEVVPGLVSLVGNMSDFSFPSGHTASAFSVASVILYKCPKRLWIPVMVLAALMALSRLYVGVHYPTDVIFAVVEGFFIGYVAGKVVESTVIKQTNTSNN